MNETIQKTKVSQDFLYKYLTEHNVTISQFARLMGVSVGIVSGSFHHDLDRHGKPLKFSRANIEKLNAALQTLADQLRQATITFGSEQTFTNSRGTTYDPGTREAVLRLSDYFKISYFMERVLGWKDGKRKMILVTPSSKVYGQVSQDDVNRINAELLSVAGVLSSYEVVPDEGSSSSSSSDYEPVAPIKKERTRKAINPDKQDDKPSKTSGCAWDDTSRDLLDRYDLFHVEHTDGVLFFRVNGGYTVAQDDARRIAAMDSSLSPYTDIASGMTTLYMDADAFARVLPRCTAEGWRVGMTDMYSAEQ